MVELKLSNVDTASPISLDAAAHKMASSIEVIIMLKRMDVTSETIRNTLNAVDGVKAEVIVSFNFPVEEDRAIAYARVRPNDRFATTTRSHKYLCCLKVFSNGFGGDIGVYYRRVVGRLASTLIYVSNFHRRSQKPKGQLLSHRKYYNWR